MPSQFMSKRWLNLLKSPLSPFIAEQDNIIYCRSISLVSLGHLRGCVSSQPVAHPGFVLRRGRVRNWKHFDAVQTLFSKILNNNLLSVLVRSKI